MVLHYFNKEIKINIYCVLCLRISGCYCNCQCIVKNGKGGGWEIDHTCEPDHNPNINIMLPVSISLSIFMASRSTSFFNFQTFKQLPIYWFLVKQTSSNTYNHYRILLDSFAFLDYAFLIVKNPARIDMQDQ